MINIYRNDSVLLLGDFSRPADFERAEENIRIHFEPSAIINLCKIPGLCSDDARKNVIRVALKTATVVYIMDQQLKSDSPMVRFARSVMLQNHDIVRIIYESLNAGDFCWEQYKPFTIEESLHRNTYRCLCCRNIFTGSPERVFCRDCRDRLNREDHSGNKLAAIYNKARPFQIDNIAKITQQLITQTRKVSK